MTDEEIWIEEIQKDKKKIAQVTAILDKVVERLKNGEKVSEIEEAMSEELDRADTLIGEVYLGY
jgi:ribosome assembly protein YihI (activator of Der GTPase)